VVCGSLWRPGAWEVGAGGTDDARPRGTVCEASDLAGGPLALDPPAACQCLSETLGCAASGLCTTRSCCRRLGPRALAGSEPGRQEVNQGGHPVKYLNAWMFSQKSSWLAHFQLEVEGGTPCLNTLKGPAGVPGVRWCDHCVMNFLECIVMYPVNTSTPPRGSQRGQKCCEIHDQPQALQHARQEPLRLRAGWCTMHAHGHMVQ
jgi:hypothetical protein